MYRKETPIGINGSLGIKRRKKVTPFALCSTPCDINLKTSNSTSLKKRLTNLKILLTLCPSQTMNESEGSVRVIISCEFCQIYENGEMVYGIGQPMLVDDLLSSSHPTLCPNCRATLSEDSLVFTDLDYHDYLFAEQVARLAA